MSKQKEREDGLFTKGEPNLTYLSYLLSKQHPSFISILFPSFDSFPINYFLFPFVLPQESERLEMLNSDLKAQIEELKLERQQLILMLNRHRPTCIVRTDSVKTPESEVNPLLLQLEAK